VPAQVLLVVAVLAAGVVVGRLVSRRTGLPEAAVFVVLGVGAAFVPGVEAGRRIRDIAVQVLLSLLVPYLAFVPAQQVHASGVLATVTAAVWLGVRGRGLVEPTVRLHAETFWRVLNTLLVALLFVLLGVQVPTVFRAVEGQAVWPVVGAAVAVTVVVVVVRLAWVMGAAPLVSLLRVREEFVGGMPWRERLPPRRGGPPGAPPPPGLPSLTVVVVLVTLVGQTLPPGLLLRALRLRPSSRERTESARARQAAVDAALRELDGVAEREEPVPPGVDELRQVLELRRDHLRDRLDESADDRGDGSGGDRSFDVRDLRLRLIEVERAALRRMHDEGEIGRATMVEISQELDLDETQLGNRRH